MAWELCCLIQCRDKYLKPLPNTKKVGSIFIIILDFILTIIQNILQRIIYDLEHRSYK